MNLLRPMCLLILFLGGVTTSTAASARQGPAVVVMKATTATTATKPRSDVSVLWEKGAPVVGMATLAFVIPLVALPVLSVAAFQVPWAGRTPISYEAVVFGIAGLSTATTGLVVAGVAWPLGLHPLWTGVGAFAGSATGSVLGAGAGYVVTLLILLPDLLAGRSSIAQLFPLMLFGGGGLLTGAAVGAAVGTAVPLILLDDDGEE